MFLRKLKCAIQKSLLKQSKNPRFYVKPFVSLETHVTKHNKGCKQVRSWEGGSWLWYLQHQKSIYLSPINSSNLPFFFPVTMTTIPFHFLLKLIKSQVCLVLLMTYVSAFPMMIEFGPPDSRFLSSNEVRPHLLWRKEESSI